MPQKSSASRKRRSRKDLRDLDVKISFLEGLVKRDQDYVEALQLLGDHYTQRGKFGHSLHGGSATFPASTPQPDGFLQPRLQLLLEPGL